ncbi:12817_t:CDS:2, partial [Racocetra fulgida]
IELYALKEEVVKEALFDCKARIEARVSELEGEENQVEDREFDIEDYTNLVVERDHLKAR